MGCASNKQQPSTVPPKENDIISPDPFETDWSDYTVFRQGLVSAEKKGMDDLSGATVYRINIAISDNRLRLTGYEKVRYTNRENVPLNKIYFLLYPNIIGGTMTVSTMLVNEEEVIPSYENQKSALSVPLSSSLEPGDTVTMTLEFEVEIPQDKKGHYGLFGYFENVLALEEFYPLIPVYDDEGWNLDMPPSHGDLTYLDASLYLVRVTAPAQLNLITSGNKIRSTTENGVQTCTFAVGPARDFYLVASEFYNSRTTTIGETSVNSYTLPEGEGRAKMALQYAVEALKIYAERFGTYPYTEFDIVGTPMLAYGMEYPGIITISDRLYTETQDTEGVDENMMLEIVTVHEVAHQWFYNVVGNDQVDDPWLDEAVVQYLTGVYYREVYGEAAAQQYRRHSWESIWSHVDKAEIPIGMSSHSYSREEYSPIVYGRGPFFLTTLEEEMGQDTFNEFLREYYESNKWEIGTEEEFKTLAETHCNCNLTPLFEKWVYGNA